jgi:hypothetical protein
LSCVMQWFVFLRVWICFIWCVGTYSEACGAWKRDCGCEKKIWIFLGGYIPKFTENRPFFARYHAKNRKLALWWPPNLGESVSELHRDKPGSC